MLKVGDRVKLKANEEEGWPEEFGELLEITETSACVQLEKVNEEHDDGLRDVTLDQLEEVKGE